jgi:CRISPR type I-E-associated protein CasB/Cse2
MSEKHSQFIHLLSRLHEDKDRQALAAFRRSLSRPPGTDLGPYRYLGSFVSEGISPSAEKRFCLIAGLYSLAPSKPHAGSGTSLGATFAAYCADKAGATKGVERRLTGLLNAHQDDLPVHMRHAVALLSRSEQSIDWIQLMNDLAQWERPDRSVQRRWARDFWGALANAATEERNEIEREENK